MTNPTGTAATGRPAAPDAAYLVPLSAPTPEVLGQAGFSLRDACFTASQEDLDEVQLAQPVIFMIEVALTELLKAWGVHPDGVIGHSAGEVAAACAAGACSLEEATRLVCHRAVLQQRTGSPAARRLARPKGRRARPGEGPAD